MINYDLHIHTEYCGHAPGMTVEAILRWADNLGLETIAITSHIFAPENLAWVRYVADDVKAVKHNCQVIIGAEVDVDGLYTDGRFVTEDLDDIDYLIVGMHYIPGPGNYPHAPADCTLQPEVFLERWRRVLLRVVSDRRVQVLAHPGRLIACSIDLKQFFDCMLNIFSEAAKISAENGIIWELNELNGQKVPAEYHSQWHRIYEIALEAGVKLIYGSDAHSPEEIARQTFTQSLIDRLGKNCLSEPGVIWR